jgi:hypothetical protein
MWPAPSSGMPATIQTEIAHTKPQKANHALTRQAIHGHNSIVACKVGLEEFFKLNLFQKVSFKRT